eukprot:scaffold1634_cov238-Chaetoceros_neogracile.AAC.2
MLESSLPQLKHARAKFSLLPIKSAWLENKSSKEVIIPPSLLLHSSAPSLGAVEPRTVQNEMAWVGSVVALVTTDMDLDVTIFNCFWSVLSDGLELTKAFPLIPVRIILNEESLFTDGMLTDGTLLKEGLTLTDG